MKRIIPLAIAFSLISSAAMAWPHGHHRDHHRYHGWHDRHHGWRHHNNTGVSFIWSNYQPAYYEPDYYGDEYEVIETTYEPVRKRAASYAQMPAEEEYCREYQANTSVGGKKAKSYGTACRQPDGSWKIMN